MNRDPVRSGAVLALTLAGISLSTHAQTPSPVQLTASSCAACHGTAGHSIGGTPVLAGLDKDHFIRQMQDFASGARPATVMNRLSKGFTDQQLQQLAEYFAAQKR